MHEQPLFAYGKAIDERYGKAVLRVYVWRTVFELLQEMRRKTVSARDLELVKLIDVASRSREHVSRETGSDETPFTTTGRADLPGSRAANHMRVGKQMVDLLRDDVQIVCARTKEQHESGVGLRYSCVEFLHCLD